MRTSSKLTLRLCLCTLMSATMLAATGCDDDQPDPVALATVDAGTVDAGPVDAANVDGGSADAAAAPPLYAMMTQVYRTDDRSVFVSLSNTLDIKQVSLPEAREFNGVANLAAIGGRLLISDGEQPRITAYDITPDLKWQERQSVSFVNFPLSDNANFYYQFILNDHTAYLPYDATKRIIWDPSDLSIRGVMDDSSLALEKDGLMLEAGGNRNSVRYNGPVLQAFFYHDKDWFHHGSSSHVVAYDPITHKETKVIDVPCAGVSIATQDEKGNTYFSTWGYLPTLVLYRQGPAPCVARIKPDLTVDTAWTTDFTAQTGGRYINNFRYVGKGKAIANVLHHELLGADFTGAYQPAIGDKIGETGPHWRFWIFDIDLGTAKPVEGINVAIGSGAQFAVLDGRTFVFLPFDNWARTKVYELDANGAATERFETTGDIFKWIRVR